MIASGANIAFAARLQKWLDQPLAIALGVESDDPHGVKIVVSENRRAICSNAVALRQRREGALRPTWDAVCFRWQKCLLIVE